MIMVLLLLVVRLLLLLLVLVLLPPLRTASCASSMSYAYICIYIRAGRDLSPPAVPNSIRNIFVALKDPMRFPPSSSCGAHGRPPRCYISIRSKISSDPVRLSLNHQLKMISGSRSYYISIQSKRMALYVSDPSIALRSRS